MSQEVQAGQSVLEPNHQEDRSAQNSFFRHRPRSWVVIPLLACVTGLFWLTQPRNFIADDSYFYLVTARNLALHGQQTFSGITDTNGFQPLWGYLLAAYSFLTAQIEPSWLWNVRYAVPLALAVMTTAGFVWWRVADQLELDPLIVACMPFIYVASLVMLYSEAPVTLLAIGLAVLRMARPGTSTRWWMVTGLIAGLVCLARVDMTFFAGAVIISLLWQMRPSRFHATTCCLALLVIVTPYYVYNEVKFGNPLPISGILKSTFPSVDLRGLQVTGLTTSVGGVSVLFALIPVIFTAAVIVFLRRKETVRGGRLLTILVVMLVGSIGQIAEIGIFGQGFTLWKWYYVLDVGMATLALALVTQHSRVLYRQLIAAGAFVVFLALMLVNVPVPIEQKFELTVAHKVPAGKTVFVSDYPGRLAFDTHLNVFAADMLTANDSFYKASSRSSNSIAFILAEARKAGHPVGAFIFNGGNNFMQMSPDESTLYLWDPGDEVTRHVVGTVFVGHPTIADGPCFFWLVR